MASRKLPQTLTGAEVTALMARPNVNCPTGLRNRAILELLLGTGLRASEACGIYVRDLDWRTGDMRIRSAVAKGGREAMVILDDETLAWLDRWKRERRAYAAGKPWMFTTLKGGQLDRRYIWEMVSRYARRAGIERPVWPHQLRHTFATDLLGEGFTIADVQQLMRHADLRTTAAYLHVRNEDLRVKVRARRRSA